MNNQNIITKLYNIGRFSLILFPSALIISFILHHMGEYSFADLITLKFIYQPPSPERFMEMFQSKDPMVFIIPHLIIYLALPLIIPAVIYLASFLFEKMPWLSVVGISLSVIGVIYMGGVFGSWLSFIAIGSLIPGQVPGAILVIAELIKPQGMLMMTSLLAAFSIVGFMVITGGLFYTRAIPRFQSVMIFLGNLIIIVFMDIDNLMLVGSTLWLVGSLPFLKNAKKY